MYEVIEKNLRSSERATNCDQRIFRRLELGEIDLNECKELFRKNNKISQKEYEKINDLMFVNWLGSLGWITNNSKTN